jgi:type VII secretion integral membrane protein EccD
VRTPAPPVYCRLTVLAPGRRVDVALPVDVPLTELVPMVLELLGEPGPPDGAGARPDPWQLTGATGGPLPPDATLEELGVLDGELLRLAPVAPPPPPPVFDDPIDALAALAAPEVGPDRRRRGAAAVLAVALAAATLLAAVSAGGDTGLRRTAVALGALGAAVFLGVAARVALRRTAPDDRPSDAPPADHRSEPDRTAAVVPACAAVPVAAAAAWAGLPGPPGAAHLLLAVVAAGTAAAVGQILVRVVAPVLIGAVVAAVLVGAAAFVGLRFGVGAPALAAITGAVALSAGPLLPRAALRLAGLPRPVVPADAAGLVAADDGPDLLPPAELAERADLARGQLAGMSGGCAVVAAVAAPIAASPGGWTGASLAAVMVTVLMLRARGYADPWPSRVHLAAGITAGVVTVGLAATAAGADGLLVGAVVLLAAAVVGAAALGAPVPTASPVARRAVDICEGVLTAAAVPLALAAAGVFAVVRAL